MTKFFLLTSISWLIVINQLAAQSYSFGVNGGINVSTISSDDETIGPSIGYHIGIVASKELNTNWSLQPGLSLSLQGAKQTDGDEFKFSYYYINLPVYFKARLGKSISVVLGPQFSTLLNATRKNDDGKENITVLVTPIDISVCAGLSASLDESVQLQVNYNIGLLSTSALKEDKTKYYPNMVFQAGLVVFVFNKMKAQ
jgi:hypothetical protein